MKTLEQLFREVILLNELSGNLKAALKFSDPDGERSGKSGWSFGISQFDTKNNSLALKCLGECGFSAAEIQGIVNQTIDVKPLAARLKASADIIARYDEQQLAYCIDKAVKFARQHGIRFADQAAILACADYVNQYGSQGEASRDYYKGLGRLITAEDVLHFKLTQTAWGKKNPSDCHRRFNNLMKVVNSAKAKSLKGETR